MSADLSGAGRYFPQDEYESRWARVEQEMKRRGYEAAVVWGRSGGSFDRCGFADVDIARCTADGLIDLSDILAVLDAFAGADDCCALDE